MKKQRSSFQLLTCCCAAWLALSSGRALAQWTINPPTFPTTNTLHLTLSGTEATNAFVIFFTPNLATGMNNWTAVVTGAVGQVTFDLTRPAGTTAFYRAGVAPNLVPPYVPSGAPNVVTGPGFLQFVGTVSNCVSANSVWLANVVCTLTTSKTMTVTFAILGGAEAAPYDVFATTNLSAAAQWGWMGQGYHCNTYALTNMPATSAFLILGTPQDSDNDGLTDAYEKLVNKTDSYNWSSAGDGVSDGWKVAHGVSPYAYTSANGLNSTNVMQVFTPLK